MKMIKRLTDIALSTILFTAACVVGCTLEDPCEPNETLSEDGRCIPIPAEPKDCGRSHYNCMSYGVKDATCELNSDASYQCKLIACASGFHRIHNQSENSAHYMPETCWQDSVTECGDSGEDCTAIEGADSVQCDLGSCKVLSCRSDEYALMQNTCIKRNVRACGTDDGPKTDCIESWLPNLYHNNATWISASIAGCADNACIVSSCRNLTDESEQSEIRFVKKSCSEVIDIAEAYKAAYLDLHHTAIELPDCMDDNENPKTIDACIEDICPDDDAKFMPGVCGCGVFEDIADDDGDGVINCLDACPHNSTKSANEGAGDCGVKDTDRDGVDDSEDVCPTKPDIDSVEQFDKTLLQQMELLDDNDNPDIDAIRNLDDAKRAKLCGIFIENGDEGIDVFHIYNAKDLDYLRVKLLEIFKRVSCSDSLDRCDGDIRTKCIDGIKRTYHCGSGACYRDDDGHIQCRDALLSSNNVSPDPLTAELLIELENDINLDDASTTLFYEDNACFSMWNPVPYITNVEFDGKGHTIRYTNLRSSDAYHRCSMSDAFFDSIRYANVHDLTLDFNMQGSGHAVFANSIANSRLNNITLKSDLLETNASDDSGVGLLAGNLNCSNNCELSDIQFVSYDAIRILAEYANNVGGVVGKSTHAQQHNASNKIKTKIVFKDKVQIEEVSGNNYVGGVIGYGDIAWDNPLSIEIGTVQGNDYVGGIIGFGDLKHSQKLKVSCDIVKGNDYVGGIIGRGGYEQSERLDLEVMFLEGHDYIGGGIGYFENYCVNSVYTSDYGVVGRFYEIFGDNYVGGLMGYVELRPNDWGANFFENTRLQSNVHYIEAKGDYVGGAFGFACSSLVNVDNYVGVVKGRRSVGGVAGGIKGKSIILLGKSSVFVRNINNVVGELYADSECAGGVLGDSDNPLELSGIHNDIGSIQAFGSGGGVSGCVEEIEEINKIYNRLGIVRTGNNFGGILGKIRRTVADIVDVSNINSYIYNVAPLDSSPDSGHVFGLFGSVEISKLNSLLTAAVRIHQLSSYVNGLSCAENYAGLLNLKDGFNVFLLSSVDIMHSVFGASGSDDTNQCYNVISSGDDKSLYDFSNSYWFSPDDDHYAPFGKDVTLNDIGLSGFGYDPSRISEIAADIKAWEPAIESIQFGGKTYELPVAFTKEQFFNRTGLVYNQSRYDDFDDWCRRVEQEYPELQGSVE